MRVGERNVSHVEKRNEYGYMYMYALYMCVTCQSVLNCRVIPSEGTGSELGWVEMCM